MVIILFLLTLAIYLATLSPTVFWWDSGEIISGCYILGISHSPGYAVYNTIGKLFTFIPVGDISFRVNLLSAFFSALSCFTFYFLCGRIVKNKFISFCISLVFAFSYTLWFYSVIAEVYSIYYCLGISLLYLLITLSEKKDIRFYYFLFFIFSLCIFLHPYFIFFAPLIFYSLIKNKLLNFKVIALFFFLFFIASGINIYLSIRSAKDVMFDFGNTEIFFNFLKVIIFRMGVSHPEIISTISSFLIQIKVIIYFFSRQIFIPYFIFSIIGFFVLFKKDKKLFFAFVVLFLLPIFPFLLFNMEEVDLWNIDYVLIFSYIVFFLFFSLGAVFLLDKFKRLTIVFLLIILLHQFYYGISINNKSQNRNAYKSGKKILSLLERNAILLTDNISLYNLLKYFQIVENKRCDVKILCTTYLSQCWYAEKVKRELNIKDDFFEFCRDSIKYNDKLDAEITEDIFLESKNLPFYVLLSKNKEQEIFYNIFSKYKLEYIIEITEFEEEKIISPFTSVLMKVR